VGLIWGDLKKQKVEEGNSRVARKGVGKDTPVGRNSDSLEGDGADLSKGRFLAQEKEGMVLGGKKRWDSLKKERKNPGREDWFKRGKKKSEYVKDIEDC